MLTSGKGTQGTRDPVSGVSHLVARGTRLLIYAIPYSAEFSPFQAKLQIYLLVEQTRRDRPLVLNADPINRAAEVTAAAAAAADETDSKLSSFRTLSTICFGGRRSGRRKLFAFD